MADVSYCIISPYYHSNSLKCFCKPSVIFLQNYSLLVLYSRQLCLIVMWGLTDHESCFIFHFSEKRRYTIDPRCKCIVGSFPFTLEFKSVLTRTLHHKCHFICHFETLKCFFKNPQHAAHPVTSSVTLTLCNCIIY